MKLTVCVIVTRNHNITHNVPFVNLALLGGGGGGGGGSTLVLKICFKKIERLFHVLDVDQLKVKFCCRCPLISLLVNQANVTATAHS